MATGSKEIAEMRYGDWMTLNASLLWCYDHEIHAPGIAIRGITDESPNGPVTGSLVPFGWALDGHFHATAWLVRSGWAEVKYGTQTIRAAPGQWLIAGRGDRVESFAEPTHLLSICFLAEWPDECPLIESGLPIVIDAKAYPSLESNGVELAKLVGMTGESWNAKRVTMDYHAFMQLNAAWIQWLHGLLDVVIDRGAKLSTNRDVDDRVLHAKCLLDAHPIDALLDQDQLASSVNLSLSQLVRLFQSQLHTTPRHYFESRRVSVAKERLRLPNMRIKEVAYGMGFKHLAHFSRWFKKQTGSSPRAYMQKQ